jgi:ankyrin repeat protein
MSNLNLLVNTSLDNFYDNPKIFYVYSNLNNKYYQDFHHFDPILFKLIANQDKKKITNLINNKIKSNPKIDINMQDNDGDSPLHIAIFLANYDIIKILLENNANVNLVDKWGQTPIHRLYFCLNNIDLFKILELLINHKCNFNKQDVNGNTILHLTLKQLIKLNIKTNNILKKFILKLKLLIPNNIKNNENITITELLTQINI